MRRLVLLVASTLGLAAAGAALAATTPRLDTQELSADQCTPAGSGARLVVDVTFVLQNYADSGYADEWAIDTVHRHLRIWRHSDKTYCAQIADGGSTFVTRAGPSPTGSGSVQSGVAGTFDGGYITSDIVGKFAPSFPKKGNLGSFDAKCDPTFACSGRYPTWLSYFKHPTADTFSKWGWIYDAGKYGVWVDSDNVSVFHGGNINS
jgi:hypothetical protein